MRVLSYNICEGGGDRIEHVADVIRGQAPDVVALLEAADRNNVEFLARMLDMSYVFAEANNPVGHIAWLSRLPVVRFANHQVAELSKTLLQIEVVAGQRSITLFATHLGSRWDVPQPQDEVPIILHLMQAAAGMPHLLAGDFNALRPGDRVGEPPHGEQPRGDAVEGAPRPALLPLLDAGYIDCYRALHPEAAGHTYPSDHPWLRIDYIFASPDLAPHLDACEVVQGAMAQMASDHLPLVAEFRETDR